MALLDNFRQGAAFINDLEQNRMANAIAPYQGEKARLANIAGGLANIHAGQENQVYVPNILSEIGLRNSQVNKNNAEIPFIPQKYRNETLNANTNAGRLQTQVNNSFRAWTQTPEGQQVLMSPNGKSIATAIYKSMHDQANSVSGGGLPDGNSQASDDDISGIQDAASDQYVNKNFPADTKKRLAAGNRFRVTVPIAQKNFELAKDYFSPSGQKQLALDQADAFKNKRVPEKLQAYRNFEQALETLKIQGAFLEGVPADQIARSQYGQVFNIPKYFNSPEDAKQLLNNGINLGLLADEANKTRPGKLLKKDSQVDEDVEKNSVQATQPTPNKIGKEHVTEKNILYTMQQTGKTRKQVMDALKKKGIL